jgi:hypothetical protein
MLQEHLRLTTEEAVARLHGDWAADVAGYDRVHAHALTMADTLSARDHQAVPEEVPKRRMRTAEAPIVGRGAHRGRGLADRESQAWLRDLARDGATHDAAVARLHALLMRARDSRSHGGAERSRTCGATSSTTSRPRRRTTR